MNASEVQAIRLSLQSTIEEESLELKLNPDMYNLLVDVGRAIVSDSELASIAVQDILSDYLAELPEE
jgi:hypothetical protein